MIGIAEPTLYLRNLLLLGHLMANSLYLGTGASCPSEVLLQTNPLNLPTSFVKWKGKVNHKSNRFPFSKQLPHTNWSHSLMQLCDLWDWGKVGKKPLSKLNFFGCSQIDGDLDCERQTLTFYDSSLFDERRITLMEHSSIFSCGEADKSSIGKLVLLTKFKEGPKQSKQTW